MRSGPFLVRAALCLSTLSSLTSAWPGWLPELDALVVRADDDSSSTGSNAKQTGVPDSNSGKASGSSSPSGDSKTTPPGPGNTHTTDLNQAGRSRTGKQTGTGTGRETGSHKSTPTTHHHTEFPINDPPGGVQLVTPATIVTPTPLYKIGDNVTFSWNYTSLQGTPTAIDVLISCTVNQETWTLTSNMSFQTDVTYVWNSDKTNHQADGFLLTELYTMIIKDTDVSITDTPEPGYLGTWSQFFFGMYAPQKYVPFNEWTCPGSCSPATSLHPSAFGALLAVTLITITSFTWFVTGLGLS